MVSNSLVLYSDSAGLLIFILYFTKISICYSIYINNLGHDAVLHPCFCDDWAVEYET